MREARVTVAKKEPPRTRLRPAGLKSFGAPRSVVDLDDEIASLRDAIEQELGLVRTLAPARARGRVRSGGRVVLSSVRRQALASARAARRLRPSMPRLAEPPAGNARVEGRPPPKLARGRTVNLGNVAFGLLSLMAAGLFALYVAVLLSA